jgi:hypothetical protein
MKVKSNICSNWQIYTQIMILKDLLKDLNVESAKSKPLKDVQNARVFGIAQKNAK